MEQQKPRSGTPNEVRDCTTCDHDHGHGCTTEAGFACGPKFVMWMPRSGTSAEARKQQIKHRFTDAVLFECELPDGIESGMAARHALERAVEARANLDGANLAGANLAGANLAGANLARAYLDGANLVRANLAGANLARAYLDRANLAHANLDGANLDGANLDGANLDGAYLAGANLDGAEWRGGIVINKRPLQVYGLTWNVTILDQHMQIGCQLHSLHEWSEFDDERIVDMDGRNALRFWRENKDALLGLARGAGRSFEPVAVATAETEAQQ